MSHEYRILEQMLIKGQISRQEFKERIDIEYGKLEQELMNDEITPDEHVERYNALMELEPPEQLSIFDLVTEEDKAR